jgi:hypothetical protein
VIEVLDKENPEYRDRKGMWQRYWDFYAGGEQLRRNASLYLVRRQKEPNDVYLERLSRVFYENYLGSCVDWYAATLFRTPLDLGYRTAHPVVEEFFTSFSGDCDCRGTSLLEMARRVFIQCLVFRESFVLIDFPRVRSEVATRAEEDAVGKSRAYLVNYTAPQLVNWKTDGNGALEWVVLKTQRVYQEAFDSGELVREDQWSYYNRENFRVYRLRRAEKSEGGSVGRGEGNEGVELVDQGRHGLAEIGRVPLVRMAVTDGLWLANKAALLQQEHFNKSNALAWALHMGLFAMPVIYSEREWQQIVGEAYYIQLGPNDKFGWTEPEGNVFQIAAENLDRIKDEIYRVCYLMTQAGGREARNLGQSGVSKQRDFAITHEVLRAYGGVIKGFVREVLDLVRRARRDDVEIAIAGMDQFDDPDFAEEVAHAEGLQRLGIRSERLEREVKKRVAMKYLDGASQEVKNEVAREIEDEIARK